MAKITISGTAGKTYNLEEISKKDIRTDASSPLSVQIWYYSEYSVDEDHKKPNPPNPEIGQIWLSKLVTDPEIIDRFNINGWEVSEIGGVV